MVVTCSSHNVAALGKPLRVAVNGIAIARDAIGREVQHHLAAKPIAAWTAAAKALVIRELLLQEARTRKLPAVALTDAAGRQETEDEAQIRTLIECDVATPAPDTETCRRYFNQNRRRFRSADIYQAAHILFSARSGDADAYAKARVDATAVLAELRKHPERFADLARKYSACPSAALAGNLGQIASGQTTPEFERALISLAPGTMCREPVATRYGFHVIRLDRRIDGQPLPFELVAERIADYLRESVQRRATAQYIARLASRARIEGIVLADAEAMRVN